MKTTVLNPFTIDPDVHSLSHGHSNSEPSLTVQADAAAADINNIVKQFGLTGGLPYGNLQPVYDDFSEYPTDYHSALNFILEADSKFMEFPAQVRSRFNNDPGNFITALNDPDQRSLFEELGFVPPKPVESPPGSEEPVKQPKGVSEPPAAPAQSPT